MLTKTSADKPYPEQKDCLENTKICTFDVEYICHECGKPLCEKCSVGIRHQPRLVKFFRKSGTQEEDRIEWHCQDPECLREHHIQSIKFVGGIGAIIIGILLISQINVPIIMTVGLVGVVFGGFLIYNEWKLKSPQNEDLSFFDMWSE